MVILKCMTEGLNLYEKVLIWGPVFIEIHKYLLNLVQGFSPVYCLLRVNNFDLSMCTFRLAKMLDIY